MTSGSNPTYSLPLLSVLIIFFSIYSLKSCSGVVFCPRIEEQSLLSFKKSLEDPNNLLSSWDDEVNCCKWKGVSCNKYTGRVHQLRLRDIAGLKGKINPSLLNLKYLRYLDLSNIDLSGEGIPSFIASLAKLEYLSLTGTGFHGKVPHAIGNLSNLHTLSLGDDHLIVDSLEWISGLSQLEYLNMNGVNLSQATNWAKVINSLPYLLELHFKGCNLDFMAPTDHNVTNSLKQLYLSDNNLHHISIPIWIFQLSSLVSLDLSSNSFMGPIPTNHSATKLQHLDLSHNQLNSSIPDWLYLCQNLEFVSLHSNQLSGTISNSVSNLTSLNTLYASSNNLFGNIPKEIANLCKLQYLVLFKNAFRGEVSDSFGNMSECFLQTMRYLDLEENRLSGHLTNQFGDFQSLEYLLLSHNSLSGVIPIIIGKLSSLEELWLRNNKLTGFLPQSLGQLFNLELLNVKDNLLEGEVTQHHFANLTKLKFLHASRNNLTLKVSPDWNPPFQLESLHIGGWNLGAGSQIPSWLERQKNIEDLGLMNTGISGTIPSWVWRIRILILSHNHLHGSIPYFLGPKDQDIYLNSNQFRGSLPRISHTIRHLDLSNNSFSGGLSHFLCHTMSTNALQLLHLGDNQLSGEIPDCWMRWPSLKYLNLGNNNMSGRIPDSIRYLANLQSLTLYGNRFSGEIPFSMHSCTELFKIDLSDNSFHGGIPKWVGNSLNNLTFLILHSNNLTGSIPLEICLLNSLQILDLSDNSISGIIPRCLHNFTAMATKRSSALFKYSYSYYAGQFIERASIVTKGSKFQYDTILQFVTNIDLSDNNLSGDIPRELTRLVELRSLNLSRNHLTGLIPERIGDMKQLESLDLSRNLLCGHIPNSLALISSLNHLNLSDNNLTGMIPESTQLQSFNASSFVGNNLCGPPLTTTCSNHEDSVNENEEDGDDKAEIEWFYVFLSLGYAVGLSAMCSALVLSKSWRDAYFGLLEWVWDKLYAFVSKLSHSTS